MRELFFNEPSGRYEFFLKENQITMFFKTPLESAIARGLKPKGDLCRELSDLGDYKLKYTKDAKAICRALSQMPDTEWQPKSYRSSLYALVSLFQNLENTDVPAFKVLYSEGLPELIRIFDRFVKDVREEYQEELLFILKILAMYGSKDGTDKVLEAAMLPLAPDAYMWNVILANFREYHPYGAYVFNAFKDRLPPGFISVSLLDSANTASINGELANHPFDSLDGIQLLRAWLQDADPDKFSYAHSATAALPFINNAKRNDLLAVAMAHPGVGVRMEAAWASAKLGQEAGFLLLEQYCRDQNHSSTAQHYLVELGSPDRIPEEVNEPEFQSLAEFAYWLAHPNELGQPPDELSVVDHRFLRWPPEWDSKPFWIIRYRVRNQSGLESDDVGCGLVGSVTWCFFSYDMNQRPPADIYAIHCYWELERNELIEESEVLDATKLEGLLGQWRGDVLDNVNITKVAEISPQLRYPGRKVAVATAHSRGEEGWVVLDESRSMWYPMNDFPDDTMDSTILMIHIGRQLLGVTEDVDRKQYLAEKEMEPDPASIAMAYERLLVEADKSEGSAIGRRLGIYEPLQRYFEKYVASKAKISCMTESETRINTYERLLAIADRADPSVHKEIFDSFSVLGDQLESYVDALVIVDRQGEIRSLLDKFVPYSDHNLGHSRIGEAAFKAGDFSFAEPHLVYVRDNLEDFGRAVSMDALATIWATQGKTNDARDLLIACLKQVRTKFDSSQYASDRQTYAEEYLKRCSTYLLHFPGEEDQLKKAGLPNALK